MHSVYPLFTDRQKDDWGHFYYSSLKRALGIHLWCNSVFSAIYKEPPLENLIWKYWSKYIVAIAGSTDEFILNEQASFNLFRKLWLDKHIIVKHLRRSKRFVPYETCIEKCLKWTELYGPSSFMLIDEKDLDLLMNFPETFL
jgi:hypothetical protein